MKTKVKKVLSYCIEKWWMLPLVSATVIVLSFLLDSEWMLISGLLLIIASVIIQLNRKRWKLGCLTGILMFLYIAISALWMIKVTFAPNPDRIHRQFARKYENRKKIQKITGVEIPDFKVVESRMLHMRPADFEFETVCLIEFKELPGDNMFTTLDSLCALPIPLSAEVNSSFFYNGLERVYGCWSKEGNKYEYGRNTDFGEKFLHSKDAYFYLTLEKDSLTANLRYGNY